MEKFGTQTGNRERAEIAETDAPVSSFDRSPLRVNRPAGILVTRTVKELRKHPIYEDLQLTVSSTQLAAIQALGELAFKDPLLITREDVIIDGYARKELAESLGIPTLDCVKVDIEKDEEVPLILSTHRASHSWPAYNRIRMAWRVKEVARIRARANQRAGGQFKGSSKLTEANVRKEVAKAAGVSEGNVTKVDQLCNADPEVLKALSRGDIRIHRAWLWRQLTWPEQREQLRQYRLRVLQKKARAQVQKHRANHKRAELNLLMLPDLGQLIERLSTLRLGVSAESESIPIVRIDAPGSVVFLTTELYELFSRHISVREEYV